ncbi:DUF1311 domain-containing protein (plasmid) [Rhizobium sp. 32-5/1]|uniref:lysozyme inhibitor LprI family protein n=1 Tax=Rhizobium sp. 32-5/1 TaxID=3019602 RepID=UPI00240D11EF|nr:lysozyme inhibitor LprI family protein [Rhizobium sp. 32-5/1]WEZ85653.1 DUF1311 domain-containing protein [Rhizobium sp. 32-5/1]
MRRLSISLALIAICMLLNPNIAGAQDISDCERNALGTERCANWQAAVQAVSLQQTVERLDSHIAELAKAGRIAPEDAEAQRRKLVASQAAWEIYRDRQCALVGAHPEGPAACLRILTEARVLELQDPDIPEQSFKHRSWSERRLLQGQFQPQELVMLRLAGPPLRTVADRVALAKGPRQTQDWNFRKSVSDLQQKLREVSRFGPLTSSFIAAEWDALRYDPETGAPLHQFPERIEGSPADNTWDKNESQAFAARLPSCLRNLADPQCRVQYSTELGCRYDTDMAAFCQSKLDGLKEVFQSYSVTDPRHRDEVYKAIACLTPAPLDQPLSGTFLVPDTAQNARLEPGNVEGRPCSELGLEVDGDGWSARSVRVFDSTMDLEIR